MGERSILFLPNKKHVILMRLSLLCLILAYSIRKLGLGGPLQKDISRTPLPWYSAPLVWIWNHLFSRDDSSGSQLHWLMDFCIIRQTVVVSETIFDIFDNLVAGISPFVQHVIYCMRDILTSILSNRTEAFQHTGLQCLLTFLLTLIVMSTFKWFKRAFNKDTSARSALVEKKDTSQSTVKQKKNDPLKSKLSGFTSWFKFGRRKEAKDSSVSAKEPEFSEPSMDPKRDSYNRPKLSIMILWVLGACALMSFPWEFVRLYQAEVAKKAALAVKGIPPECNPDQMTMWQSVKSYCRWQFSWDHTPCEAYHQAMLVDPIWEVSPLMVVSAACARCVTTPLEILSSGIGTSLRVLFSEIPVVWQPIVMSIITILTLLLTVMFCRYKITLPFFLRIEPSIKPVVICNQEQKEIKKQNTKSVEWSGDLAG